MSPEVYPPSEDTALLIAALAKEDVQGFRALEVGSGSGAVSHALARRGARVVAVDINPDAVAATRALIAGDVLRGDLMTALRGPFDMVVFNAPYLPSSPEERVEGWLDHAFHGGEGGIEVSERFARDLRRVLAPTGRAYLVVSSRAEVEELRETLVQLGFTVEKVAAERFFFEEVAVWKLS